MQDWCQIKLLPNWLQNLQGLRFEGPRLQDSARRLLSKEMVRKYGVDTDEFDKESREAAEDIVKQQIAKEWTYEELQQKYQNLKAVTEKNFPHLWKGLEFALTVKTILNIKENTLPFIGIILGSASTMKTFIIELFRDYDLTHYTDFFSPKSFVSHNSGVSEDEPRQAW